MMFHTHLVFAFFLGLMSLKFLNFSNPYLFLILVLIFSLLPDIDMAKSKIGKKTGFVSKIIEFLFGHRGIFHTIYPAVGLFILFYYLGYKLIAFSALIGYLSHLLIDGLTLSGVNLLKPLNLRINGFIKTGSIFEHLVFVIFLLADIVYFIIYILN